MGSRSVKCLLDHIRTRPSTLPPEFPRLLDRTSPENFTSRQARQGWSDPRIQLVVNFCVLVQRELGYRIRGVHRG
jgi:hypothetical protein